MDSPRANLNRSGRLDVPVDEYADRHNPNKEYKRLAKTPDQKQQVEEWAKTLFVKGRVGDGNKVIVRDKLRWEFYQKWHPERTVIWGGHIKRAYNKKETMTMEQIYKWLLEHPPRGGWIKARGVRNQSTQTHKGGTPDDHTKGGTKTKTNKDNYRAQPKEGRRGKVSGRIPSKAFISVWIQFVRKQKNLNRDKGLGWWKRNYVDAKDWESNLKLITIGGWQLGRRTMQIKYKEIDAIEADDRVLDDWKDIDSIPSQRFIQVYLDTLPGNQARLTPGHKAKSIKPFTAAYPNEALQVDTAYIAPKGENARTGLIGFLAMIDVATRRGYARAVQSSHTSKEAADHLLGTIPRTGPDSKRPAEDSMLREAEDYWLDKGFTLNPRRNEQKYPQPKNAGEYVPGAAIDPAESKRWSAPGVRITKIVTDKGSEFEKELVTRMKQLQENVSAQGGPGPAVLGKYKQQFSFEGKSQSNGLVERFNKTLKGLIMGLLPRAGDGKPVWKDWDHWLPQAVDMYNSTRHGVTQHKPNELNNITPPGPNYYRRAIWNVSKKIKKFADTGAPMQVGQYVRLIRYNASKKGGVGAHVFTLKGGTLVSMLTDDDPPELREKLQGLYTIEKIFTPPTDEEGMQSKATTYGVVAVWHAAGTTEQTAPIPGITRGYTAKRVDRALLKADEDAAAILFKGRAYPAKATMRKFVHDELSPVSTTEDHHTPAVQDIVLDPPSADTIALAVRQRPVKTVRATRSTTKALQALQAIKASKASKGGKASKGAKSRKSGKATRRSTRGGRQTRSMKK